MNYTCFFFFLLPSFSNSKVHFDCFSFLLVVYLNVFRGKEAERFGAECLTFSLPGAFERRFFSSSLRNGGYPFGGDIDDFSRMCIYSRQLLFLISSTP